MDVNDGHISGPPGQGPHSVADTGGGRRRWADPYRPGRGAADPSAPARDDDAGRYLGLELDPNEFRRPGERDFPSAASLSTWAQNTGMWSRAVRLRWRHLMRFTSTGPVVLLFNDGTAGLLTGVNAEHKVVFIKDPRAAQADPPVPVDELRLAEVWSGEAVLLRANRGYSETDAPFTLRWLVGLVLEEKRSLRDIGVASLAISMLTIFPPLLVMTVVDKVLTHQSYSTLVLIAVIVGIAILYETLLGYARRLIMLVIGARIDAKLNLHVFNRLLRLPLDYFERHPAGETMYKISQIHRVREFLTGKLLTTFLDLITLCVLLPFLFWLQRDAGLDRAGLRLRDRADHPGVPASRCGDLRPRGGRRDREAVGAGRDDLRHQDREVAGAGAAAQGAVGRADRRGRQMAPRLRPARQLAADAGHADRALHVDGRDPGRRLSGADRRDRLHGRRAVRLHDAVAARGAAAGRAGPADRGVRGGRRRDRRGRRRCSTVRSRWTRRRAGCGRASPARSPSTTSRSPMPAPRSRRSTASASRSRPAPCSASSAASGSGKSTITRLLQGINRDYTGFLKIDGSDLREINLRHLRQSFGVVLQDNFLFRGSIRDNIIAGRPGLTLEDAVRAARLAGAEEFIERMPNGYETYIEEGSPNLSGGQKQRLAIARALITDPRILILDEATSALDPESEALVNANLLRIARGRTMVIVSHRLVVADRMRPDPGAGKGRGGRHRAAPHPARTLHDLPPALGAAEPSPRQSRSPSCARPDPRLRRLAPSSRTGTTRPCR